MKKLFHISIICLIISLIITSTIVFVSKIVYKELTTRPDIPKDAKWDSNLGMYVRSNLEYDVETNKLLDKSNVEQSQPGISEIDSWILSNSNSSDEVNKAIINWITERNKTSEDGVGLGIDYIPQLMKKAYKENLWATPMQTAIEKICKFKCMDYNDGSKESQAKWFNSLKELVSSAPMI